MRYVAGPFNFRRPRLCDNISDARTSTMFNKSTCLLSLFDLEALKSIRLVLGHNLMSWMPNPVFKIISNLDGSILHSSLPIPSYLDSSKFLQTSLNDDAQHSCCFWSWVWTVHSFFTSSCCEICSDMHQLLLVFFHVFPLAELESGLEVVHLKFAYSMFFVKRRKRISSTRQSYP